jgi:hypothetical protein
VVHRLPQTAAVLAMANAVVSKGRSIHRTPKDFLKDLDDAIRHSRTPEGAHSRFVGQRAMVVVASSTGQSSP